MAGRYKPSRQPSRQPEGLISARQRRVATGHDACERSHQRPGAFSIVFQERSICLAFLESECGGFQLPLGILDSL